MAEYVFGQVAVGINHGATFARQNILSNTVLQEFTFPPTGETHYIGMEISYFG